MFVRCLIHAPDRSPGSYPEPIRLPHDAFQAEFAPDGLKDLLCLPREIAAKGAADPLAWQNYMLCSKSRRCSIGELTKVSPSRFSRSKQ